MGIGLDLCPFICIVDVAFSDILLMRYWEHSSKPYSLRSSNKYVCEMLSKASLKSIDNIHSGVLETSAYATASRIAATASNMADPSLAQCWLGLSIPGVHYRSLFAVILPTIRSLCSTESEACSLLSSWHPVFWVGKLVRHASGSRLLSHRRTFGS